MTETAPIATEQALREHLVTWLGNARRRSRTILVRAQPIWSGPPVLTVGDETVRIVQGISSLAVLDAMHSAAKTEYLAVLTSLTEAELGTPVVLDAERQRLTHLDEWSSVPGLFGARDGVARPVRELGPWVPQLATALRPDRGYTPAPGAMLTAEHIVRSVVAALLGLDRLDALESSEALALLDDLGVRARLSDLEPVARRKLIDAISTHIDPNLAMAFRAAIAPQQLSAIAVGLVAGELWASGHVAPDQTVAAARVRAEYYIGAQPIAAAAKRYGASARLITQRWLADDAQHAREVLEQAEALCVELGWADGAGKSEFLPAGLRARVADFATAIEAAVVTPDASASLRVDAALVSIDAHGAKASFARSMETARMAARLVRWLTAAPAGLTSVTKAIAKYSTEGAWVERALGDIWNGDTDPNLARAYQALAHAVQHVRREQDAAAATSLTGDLVFDDRVLPVERVLPELVVPLAARDRVLLVVLDGMSVPTAVELAAEMPAQGWGEIVQGSVLRRGTAMAVLPTITEYSRTSLFAGELLAGNQQIEKSRFAAAVKGVVFHKDDLRADAGHALPPAVSNAIADSGKKIVGIVLNTIDDTLANADVDALRWTVHSVAHLEAILDAARDAGRIVVFTSDHGHVVERGSKLRNIAQASARWRDPVTGPATEGEVYVTGPRVLAPGGSAVLAVSDGLRYASKKAGYHGGGSLAELTIPLLVLKPRGARTPAGWVEAPPQEPTWWNEPVRVTTSAAPAARLAKRAKSVQQSKESALFELESAPTGAPALGNLEILDAAVETEPAAQLIASEVYQSRRKIAGRHPVDDQTAANIIVTLMLGGGRAHRDTLAKQAGLPSSTMSGLLAALRRVLNIDGYPVLDFDSDGVTVVLDTVLLREQFQLQGNA